MLEIQALDELERMVAIVELQAATIEAAFHSDGAVLAASERLERKITNSLDEHRPPAPFVPHLFALKVRLGAARERMLEVQKWQSPAFPERP
jgi:hypothetical protein